MTKTQSITTHSTAQASYTIQTRTRDGREYLVVPVVMLVEGVHNGSAGPVLHLQQNFSRNPQDWNGVPLTAHHPQNGRGEYVSVRQVNQDHWVVGRVENARVEEGKLKAEAWIDRQRAIAVNPEVINYLMEGRPLEVSTGMGTRDIPTRGQYNGEEYHSITLEYVPDHLALLPGEVGACSWQDGCGIRVNQKQEEESDEMSIKKDIEQGLGVHNGLQTNQAGFVELTRRIQSMLDRRDSEARSHWLTELYEDHFVYEVRDRDQGTQKFFRQEYSFNEGENNVDLQGDSQEVRREVEFVPLGQQQNKQTSNAACGCTMKRTKFNNQNEEDTMSDTQNKQPSGEVMDKVVSLINNERTRFSKADRSWLLQLNEEQLEKLEPIEAPEAEVTREQALQALSEDLSDTEKLVRILPDEVRSQVEAGIQAYKDNRSKLIKSIQANTGDIWKTEKLESMDTETLMALEKSSRKTDYSGNGQPVQVNAGQSEDAEMLLPVGMKLES